jgi:hypothetical protein
MGDTETAALYRSTAETIRPSVVAHYDPSRGYIYESVNREQDSSVLHAIATFGIHAPESNEVCNKATLRHYGAIKPRQVSHHCKTCRAQNFRQKKLG